ncbi:hypothetical protein [Lactobacillus delbrueckii]|uniref:Uncharacterized protein n=1 Tax=Lactobacillus delbrueckii subsp. bulgaricus TaxID=1585 RepID=A0AAV5PEQ3_LACDE|nr:hypothetical protein [Lactobacillus delbrueckii subsp. bulgaricus]GMB83864.1 hypothetical protein ME0899_00880 [Lactobacillus delbrueckii subsp. bulgaricus]GMB87114.1 hypothetical protein ME0900_14870 [Lactobacillus delbrueckii subsp. bulgaricus]GMB88449.1 hypothetical protein ME0901_09710 [Lactobacillus delbrueckii subsp. bulgaricus]
MKPNRKADLLDKGFLSKRAAEVMKRAKNLVRRQEKEEAAKQGLLSNIEEAPALDLNFKADYHQTLFTGRDLSLEIAGRTLFQGLNLAIAQPRDCGFDRAKRQRQEQFFGLALG